MFYIIDNSHSVDRFILKDKKYGNYSITVSAVESWNKIQKKFKKICYLEIYPPMKFKKLSVLFILNHINNSLIMQKLYLALIRGIIAVINYTC